MKGREETRGSSIKSSVMHPLQLYPRIPILQLHHHIVNSCHTVGAAKGDLCNKIISV